MDTHFEPGLAPRGRRTLQSGIDPRVFLLKVFPGLDPALPLALLPHLKGLVVEAYGAGNFPVSAELGRSLRPVLREAHRRKIPVVVVTQAFRNGVDLTLYESGAAAVREGAISGGDMTSSTAVVKLMHALACCRTVSEVARFMVKPLAGEVS